MSELDKFELLGKYEKEELLKEANLGVWFKRTSLFVIGSVVLSLAGCPSYNVWKQGLAGKAELARAEHNRRIKIEEAIVVKESAEYKADAEIERARGINEANKVISSSLGGPEGYLRYLYIDALQATSCQTIYIPTEAGLPILEARGVIRGE